MDRLLPEEGEIALAHDLLKRRPARLQALARDLAKLLKLEAPTKPQEISNFIEVIEKRLNYKSHWQHAAILEAYGAELIETIKSSKSFVTSEKHLFGESVEWGANSNSKIIKSSDVQVWMIPNAVVTNWHGQFLVFDSRGTLISDVSSRYWPIASLCNVSFFNDGSHVTNSCIDAGFLSVSDDDVNNYCHWISNILTRMSLAKVDQVFILPQLERNYQVESLDVLGWKNRVETIQFESVRTFARLFVSTNLGIGLKHPFHRGADWAIEATDNLVSRSLSRFDNRNTPARIFVSRSLAKKRRLVNESEIYLGLRKLDFELKHMEEIDFVEQVSIFLQSQFVIGAHGAGLTGVAFMRENTNLIEIHGNTYGTPAFKIMAGAKGVNYFSATGQNVEEKVGNRSDILLDSHTIVEEVKKLLTN